MPTSITPNSKCPNCGEYKNRAISIDAIIEQDGKILLVKRGIDPYKGYWAIPGGHVDFDETLEQSTVREVKEETGLTVTKLTLFGIYSDPGRHPRQTIAVAYIVEVEGVPIAGDDAVELAWFSPKKLPPNMAFDHLVILHNFISSNNYKKYCNFKKFLPISFLIALILLLILRVTPLNETAGQTCLDVCIGPIDSIFMLIIALPSFQALAFASILIPESLKDSLYSVMPQNINYDIFITIVFGVLNNLIALFIFGFMIDEALKMWMVRKHSKKRNGL